MYRSGMIRDVMYRSGMVRVVMDGRIQVNDGQGWSCINRGWSCINQGWSCTG